MSSKSAPRGPQNPKSTTAGQKRNVLREQLENLKKEYEPRLKQRVNDLAQLTARSIDNAQRAFAVGEIREEAHKLRGTAGIYGYKEVSSIATTLEAHSRRWLDQQEGRAKLWPLIEANVSELTRLAVPWAAFAELDPKPGAEPLARLLVVDDDSLELKSLKLLAESVMVDIVTVKDEQGALEQLQDETFDGVLLDVHLHGTDGFTLAQKLRQLPDREDLCVGFISGSDTLSNRVAAAHAGALMFLTKPLTAAGLRDAATEMAAVTRADLPTILLVEDDPEFARHVEVVLKEHRINVKCLADPNRVLEVLADVRPDLLLLDVELPNINGLEICKSLRAMPEWRELLILFVSADASLETRMACFNAGADDYLQKPIVKGELLARTRVRLERQRMARERWESDPLTGLSNRRAFLNAFAARLSEARRKDQVMSLVLLDVDHFKRVNDTHGHLVGDRVLSALGKLLARSFRPSDLRGRWGGEEFILAFDGEHAAMAKAITDRVLQNLLDIDFVNEGGAIFHTSFSGGVASYPQDGNSLEQLLQVADRRLYAAKKAGRARVLDVDTWHERGHLEAAVGHDARKP